MSVSDLPQGGQQTHGGILLRIETKPFLSYLCLGPLAALTR
jgi:hypothetical protein